MKRLFLVVSLLLVASMLLVACGKRAEPTPEPTEPPDVEETEEPEVTEEPDPYAETCGENVDESVCAVFAPGDVVKIGYAGPTAGDYSAFGIDISQGGLIAITDFGTVDGWAIELLIEDTGGSGEGGAAVANLYCSNPDVVAISGHTFSGSTAAAIPIYDECRRPMLSASATRADLTQMADQDVFNRIPFTDDLQGTKIAEYLFNTLGLTEIAGMHDGDAYGQGLAEKVRDVFTDLGGTVVAFEAITPGETDYSAALAAVSAVEPGGIFYGGYDAEAAVLLNQMGVAGLGDAEFFGCDGTFGIKLLDLAGANAEGAYATALVPPSSPEKDAFDAAYEAAYGDAPGTLSAFTWNGYDVVGALISVINDVAFVDGDGNLIVPREAMVAGVRGLSGYLGLTGEIACNEVGECNTAGPTFYVIQGGAWVEAP
ncbi:MAG: branched-chain amino acid ABC transporter substrate-binding protein [Anaerolineales bacterium]|jgi:branched-chain amino acid transport system substrate-binding protein